MGSLYLVDIMNRAGLDPSQVMLIRHSLNDKDFNRCYEADRTNRGVVFEYTRHQKESFAKNAKYWMIFISDSGTKARFYACYKVEGKSVKSTKEMALEGFPIPDWYGKEGDFLHTLQETDIMSDLEGRLIIEWGRATNSWFQWGTNEKEVVSIQLSQKKTFEGFDNLLLTYDELKEIVEDGILYENWHTAMSSVYAIYLISDTVDGQLYVGSASKENGGLLARWSDYIKTKHGGNVLMKKKLAEHPERFHNFQFQVLQVLPPTMIKSDVDRVESLWKNKLLSRKFGMNDN